MGLRPSATAEVLPEDPDQAGEGAGEEVLWQACRVHRPEENSPQTNQEDQHLKQKRPRSRTLQAVHTAILDDLVYPAEIVGKRIRIRLDGSRLFKVHLDKTQQTNIEHKTETFASVYKKLTGKEVNFEFPEAVLYLLTLNKRAA